MADLPRLKNQLLETKYGYNESPAADGVGVYAIFLVMRGALGGLDVGPCGLIYLSSANSSLEARNHFACPDSGYSTLRRSLGALLKAPLQLRAIPRTMQSPVNRRTYRFCDRDELRLTKWMEAHLNYGFVVIGRGAKAKERELTAELRPPLNLIHWHNPQGPYLRALRAACRNEAHNPARAPELRQEAGCAAPARPREESPLRLRG